MLWGKVAENVLLIDEFNLLEFNRVRVTATNGRALVCEDSRGTCAARLRCPVLKIMALLYWETLMTCQST